MIFEKRKSKPANDKIKISEWFTQGKFSYLPA